jgi:hypothetical protein
MRIVRRRFLERVQGTCGIRLGARLFRPRSESRAVLIDPFVSVEFLLLFLFLFQSLGAVLGVSPLVPPRRNSAPRPERLRHGERRQ